ncbi:MAG TPA: hypothetical protein VH482_00320 [Thermomicrobiales bacterium]
MTVKEEIQDLVDTLDDQRAIAVLDYVRLVIGATEQPDAGPTPASMDPPVEFLKIGRPTSDDDPRWNIVSLVTDEADGPTDVAANHDKYLAETYADLHEDDGRPFGPRNRS